jgi:hypothetical protein
VALKRKLTAEEHTKLPADHQGDYKKIESGEDAGMFALDLEGDDDVAGLKSAFEKTKKETLDLKGELKEARESGSADKGKIKELEGKIKASEEKELKQKDDWQALLDRQKADYEAKLKDSGDKLTASEKRTQDILLDHATEAAIAKGKGLSPLLFDIVRKRLVLETDGKTGKQTVRVAALEGDGKFMMHPKTPSDPITPEQFVETLREDTVYARAFEGVGSSGGGAPGNGTVRTQTANGQVVISREDAKNHSKYVAAQDKAKKEGMELVIAPE